MIPHVIGGIRVKYLCAHCHRPGSRQPLPGHFRCDGCGLRRKKIYVQRVAAAPRVDA